MSINDVQDEIVEEFSYLTERLDKFEHLISLGKSLEILDDEHKTDENLISGCQSTVWIVAILENGTLTYKGDSNTAITKGILKLLIKIFNNQSPEDITKSDLYFSEEIGLKQNLSPTRVIGLGSMIKQMKLIAEQFIQ